QLRLESVVAMPPEPPVDAERRAERQPAPEDGAVRPDDEGEGTEQVRRDARERPSFANRLARVIQPSRLQRSKAAVGGPLVVEGGGGAEAACLDERDAEPARGRVERGGESVNPAADDQRVVGGCAKGVEVARAHPENI